MNRLKIKLYLLKAWNFIKRNIQKFIIILIPIFYIIFFYLYDRIIDKRFKRSKSKKNSDIRNNNNVNNSNISNPNDKNEEDITNMNSERPTPVKKYSLLSYLKFWAKKPENDMLYDDINYELTPAPTNVNDNRLLSNEESNNNNNNNNIIQVNLDNIKSKNKKESIKISKEIKEGMDKTFNHIKTKRNQQERLNEVNFWINECDNKPNNDLNKAMKPKLIKYKGEMFKLYPNLYDNLNDVKNNNINHNKINSQSNRIPSLTQTNLNAQDTHIPPVDDNDEDNVELQHIEINLDIDKK